MSKNTIDRKSGGHSPAAAGWCLLFLLILLPILAMTGCTGPAGFRRSDLPLADSPRYLLDSVPFFPQKVYQCGPAALAMALSWSGVHLSPDDLTPEVFTLSKKGSLQSAMIAAVRRHDRIAWLLPAPDALLDELRAGNPVIVLQNLGLAWYPVWHYAVVIGLDLEKGNVILHSGVTQEKHVALERFNRTWRRGDYWGLVVLPPSRLPDRAEEADYLRAVGPLERLKKWTVAARAYRSALARWPGSLAARLGLGACLYESGDLEAAEAVFRETTVNFPHDGAAFNNLAQVLMDQGRADDALEAIRHAIQLGGPLTPQFEETLREIRRQ
ncbi:PA2778 family cysteine peptidase [Desulfosarcina ovata]|uniref:PA2778 family cysteine peptidase n=1 Tax=Desulfosarcina ovata TaxID=83564 RepID=UPI0012D2C41E|nr:PA2778 family cysteine peptidase [Desulfosarcina ovata]